MTLELAIRLTEILLGLAFIQQSFEDLAYSKNILRNKNYIPLIRLILSLLLVAGVQTAWVSIGLFIMGVWLLQRFQGPYNGGSDRMGLLILSCLTLVHFMPSIRWQEYIFGYLAAQLVLSYFMAGWVKIINPAWRNGQALQDVFKFSAYPVSDSIRQWAHYPKLLAVMSWLVILFELLFPFSLLSQTTLYVALAVAVVFHVTNVCLFGLNRFVWVWVAAYPSIVWLQERIF